MEFAWKDANVVLFISTIDDSKYYILFSALYTNDIIYRQVNQQRKLPENDLPLPKLAPK